MKFQVFHVNPGEKLKKKDVNNDLSHFMSVFPIKEYAQQSIGSEFRRNYTTEGLVWTSIIHSDELLFGSAASTSRPTVPFVLRRE